MFRAMCWLLMGDGWGGDIGAGCNDAYRRLSVLREDSDEKGGKYKKIGIFTRSKIDAS